MICGRFPLRHARYLVSGWCPGCTVKQCCWCCGALAFALTQQAQAQAVPNIGERIERLVTFGAQSDKQWGDDDFT